MVAMGKRVVMCVCTQLKETQLFVEIGGLKGLVRYDAKGNKRAEKWKMEN